jgi:hypothetical protein
MTGVYGSGQKLEANRIADDISVSMTPVRDALNRLTGEGLVVAETGEGFRVPLITTDRLRDWIEWSRHLSMLCIRHIGRKHGLARSVDNLDHADRTAMLFATIAARTDMIEATIAFERLSARLHRARMLEGRLLPSAEIEVCRIEEACFADDNREAGRLLNNYHRSRLRIVLDLVREMSLREPPRST